MKLVVFAHVPPPHHGQSFMVKQLVDGLEAASGGEIELFHVDARLSRSIDDMGGAGVAKVLKLLRYSLKAIWLRVSKRAGTLYYVPAPPKRAALYRDWIVLALCRPFFRRVVFHWHAVGLGEWVDGEAETPSPPKSWERKLTRWLLGRIDLSIVLSQYNRADAERLAPKRVSVVPNGIPDPCEDFEAAQRRRAASERDDILRVLYLGHCTAEKGLFDAVAAAKLANAEKPRVRLTVAGEFLFAEEQERFEAEVAGDDSITHVGFLGGDAKGTALCEHDCLCFPTYYSAESFGLVLVEAMAFGLIPLASDWRTVGELARSAGLEPFPAKSAQALAEMMVAAAAGRAGAGAEGERLRQHFLDHFLIDEHLEGMANAIREIDS